MTMKQDCSDLFTASPFNTKEWERNEWVGVGSERRDRKKNTDAVHIFR